LEKKFFDATFENFPNLLTRSNHSLGTIPKLVAWAQGIVFAVVGAQLLESYQELGKVPALKANVASKNKFVGKCCSLLLGVIEQLNSLALFQFLRYTM